MSNLRFKVLQEAFAKKAVAVQPPAGMVSDYYGNHVFDNVYKTRQVYDAEKARSLSAHDDSLIEELSVHIASIKQNLDKLELIVDDELWPLPKYREILFSH